MLTDILTVIWYLNHRGYFLQFFAATSGKKLNDGVLGIDVFLYNTVKMNTHTHYHTHVNTHSCDCGRTHISAHTNAHVYPAQTAVAQTAVAQTAVAQTAVAQTAVAQTAVAQPTSQPMRSASPVAKRTRSKAQRAAWEKQPWSVADADINDLISFLKESTDPWERSLIPEVEKDAIARFAKRAKMTK